MIFSNISSQHNFTVGHGSHSNDLPNITNTINNNNKYGRMLLHIDEITVWIQILSIGFSLVGNCLVIFGTCNLQRLTLNKMVINYLAICDLIYSFIQTLYVHRKLTNHRWHFGKLLCRLTVLSPCAISSSFFIITFIAYERHRSIVYPLQLRFKRCKTTILMIGIFLLAILLQSPYLFHMKVYQVRGDHVDCGCLWDTEARRYWDLVVFVFTYPLPIAMLLYCYIRIIVKVSRRFTATNRSLALQKNAHTRNKKMCVTLAAIVAIFVITTSPNQMLVLWKDFGDKYHEDAIQTFVILYGLSTLVHLHSFANPIIYSLSDPKFRKVLCHSFKMTNLRKTTIRFVRRIVGTSEDYHSNHHHQQQLQQDQHRSNEFNPEKPDLLVHHEQDNILSPTRKFQDTYL